MWILRAKWCKSVIFIFMFWRLLFKSQIGSFLVLNCLAWSINTNDMVLEGLALLDIWLYFFLPVHYIERKARRVSGQWFPEVWGRSMHNNDLREKVDLNPVVYTFRTNKNSIISNTNFEHYFLSFHMSIIICAWYFVYISRPSSKTEVN